MCNLVYFNIKEDYFNSIWYNSSLIHRSNKKKIKVYKLLNNINEFIIKNCSIQKHLLKKTLFRSKKLKYKHAKKR